MQKLVRKPLVSFGCLATRPGTCYGLCRELFALDFEELLGSAAHKGVVGAQLEKKKVSVSRRPNDVVGRVRCGLTATVAVDSSCVVTSNRRVIRLQ